MNDVIHTVTDGLMGFGNISGTGVHIKIGASPVQSDEPVIITSTRKLQYMTKNLGLSPLRDAVMDSVENGASRIICIPVNPSAQGEIKTLDPAVSDKSGTITIDGKPNNRFDIIVRITGRGVLNTASFKYSINDGHTFSEELTVPLSGEFELPDTGTKINFVLGEAQDYELNDTYRWQTTAPKLTNEDVMKGINLIKTIKQEAELVHIVGSCGADTWAMVSAMQAELQVQYHKPLMFVLEAFEKGADESMDDYVAALKAARKLVKNYQIQVVAARMLYAGMDGLGRDTNAAGVVSADATASPSDILEGQTAYNGTVLITGNMRDIRGTTVTTETVTQDENYTYLSVPEEGCYGTDSKIRTKNSNFTPEFELVEGVCKPGDVIDLKKQIVAIAIAYNRQSMLASTSFWAVSFGNVYRYPTSTNAIIIDGTKATLTYRGGVAGGGGDTDPADYYMALVVK